MTSMKTVKTLSEIMSKMSVICLDIFWWVTVFGTIAAFWIFVAVVAYFKFFK